jgi:hypothetical protein
MREAREWADNQDGDFVHFFAAISQNLAAAMSQGQIVPITTGLAATSQVEQACAVYLRPPLFS